MLLLPAQFRALGLSLVAAGLSGFWIATSNGLINLFRVISPGRVLPDGSYPYPPHFWEVNAVSEIVSLCFIVAGIAAVFLAKEPDEYYYKIRLESIQFAVAAQFVVGLLAFTYFYISPGYQMANAFQSILGMAGSSFVAAYLLHYYFKIYFKPEQD
ncbi:hypothetical protein [Dyadobacter crusticola]|uniref:hypothetical protein n=1 Tax=Dyadobacter crusticola TaxID=292407 RepID=UPI000B149D30|nr:hypothetical protein [Dyadobacter crusticola]